MFGNRANLIWSSMFAISGREAPLLRIRSHNFFEMPVALTREQFCSLDRDPWVRQFLAMRRTQTRGGVLSFIQQTQEVTNVPELVPQSICQFRDPPYLNVLLPKSLVAPLDATHDDCCSRRWHHGTAQSGSINPKRPRPRDFCLRPSVTVKRCRPGRQALALDPRLQLETK